MLKDHDHQYAFAMFYLSVIVQLHDSAGFEKSRCAIAMPYTRPWKKEMLKNLEIISPLFAFTTRPQSSGNCVYGCVGGEGSTHAKEWRTTCSSRSGIFPPTPSSPSSWHPPAAKPPWMCRWWGRPLSPQVPACTAWASGGCSWWSWWTAWPLIASADALSTCGGSLMMGSAQCRQLGREGMGGTWNRCRGVGWSRPGYYS